MPPREPGQRPRQRRRGATGDAGPEHVVAYEELNLEVREDELGPDFPEDAIGLAGQEEDPYPDSREGDPFTDGQEDQPDPDGQDYGPEPGGPEAQLDLDSVVVSLVESMRDAVQRVTVADSAAAGRRPHRDRDPLERDRDQLVLQYDALRTALGRPGAAALVLYRVVSRRREHSGGTRVGIQIESGQASARNWIVLYGGTRTQAGSVSEIGRAEYRPDGDLTTWVPVDIPDPVVSRLEVWDNEDGRPIRLGRRLDDHPPRSSASLARR
jgi:hypothetical protein